MKPDEQDPGRACWQAHMDAWMDGDLSQRDYCALHGLSRSSFHRWRVRLKDETLIRERRALARRNRRQNKPLPEVRLTPSRGRIRRASDCLHIGI